MAYLGCKIFGIQLIVILSIETLICRQIVQLGLLGYTIVASNLFIRILVLIVQVIGSVIIEIHHPIVGLSYSILPIIWALNLL